jgi:hypothetical protein
VSDAADVATATRPLVRPPQGFTFVYFFGTEDGGEVKLGRTNQPHERMRQHENNAGRHEPLRWLAVLVGAPADEKALKRHFQPYTSRGRSGEWIHAGDVMRDYLRFLRDQPYVASAPDHDFSSLPYVDSSHWLPNAGRRKMISQLDLSPQVEGDPWADLATSVVMDGDFYTHPEIIEAARLTMGGIDLDPASCSEANRVVAATRFFGAKENGLLHPWEGRVWLNPPYGGWGNAWVPKLLSEWKAGQVDQMCALATTRVITAQGFHPLVRAASALWVGRGRWRFWGPKAGEPDEGHVVFYFGGRLDDFRAGFSPIGTVFRAAGPEPGEALAA